MSEKKEEEKVFDWYRIITFMEKTLLVVIAFLTTYAVVVEIFVVVSERAVELTDLLLLFNVYRFPRIFIKVIRFLSLCSPTR